MNLPGLLIEYLIVGAIALIWIGVIFSDIDTSFLNKTDSQLFLIPMAYVLGIFIDFIAWIVTKPIKKIIRNHAIGVVRDAMLEQDISFNENDYKHYWNEKITIEKSYPDLNKELSGRSSRDRIARGVVINLIPITIVFWSNIHVYGILAIIIASLMWIRFEHYNFFYELRAVHSIRNESILEINKQKK